MAERRAWLIKYRLFFISDSRLKYNIVLKAIDECVAQKNVFIVSKLK